MKHTNFNQRFQIFALAICAFAFLGFFSTNAAAQEYNATNEYSLTQGGTTGVWNYGYSTSDTNNTFNPYVTNDTIVLCSGGVFQRWLDQTDVDGITPQIARTTTAVPCSSVPPEALFVHPGFSGRRSVLRWTAPAAGTYLLNGVLGKQNPGASSDLKILKNVTEPALFSAIFVGLESQHPFNFTVTVAAGDTIDFSVGWGVNGNYGGDASLITVTIGQPVTACLASPTNQQVFVPGENSPMDVQSVNSNASLVGEATYTNAGKVGRAFSFDGTGDYVRVEDNPAQRPATSLTTEGWFKFNSTSGLISLVGKPIRGSSLNSYALYLENGTLRGLIGNASQFTRVFSNFAPQLGVWNHLAFTYDFTGGISTLKLYANGVEVTSGQDGTANLPLFYESNPYPLLIGGEFENDAPSFFLNGQADEVAIYGRALTQPEIFNIVKQSSFGKCPPAACVQPPNNLVSWFAGEQNALDSRSNNHGTMQNGATFANGQVGQAFNLNGTSHIAVPDNSSLDFGANQDFSIETWIRATSVNSTTTIIEKRDPNNNLRGYVLYLWDTGALTLQINDGINFGNYISSSADLRDGQWHHVAVSVDRDNPAGLKFFVDGMSVGTQNPTGFQSDLSNGEPFFIGKHVTSPAANFVGQIDEVGIYNTALSISEILSIYNAGQSGKCKPSPLNPAANQIAWFTGDGDTRDFLGLNPNGILRGDANFKVGRVGQSFSFDGNGDYVEIADDADHRPANITIEGWFKANSVAGAPHFVSKPLVGNNSNSYVIWYQNGELRGGHGNSSGGFDTVLTGFTPDLGTWYHFAYTIDDAADTHRFFVNGVQIATAGTSLPIFYDTTMPHPLLIGGELDSNALGSFLNGQADEVSLYSRALSPSELAAVYNAGTAGKLKSITTPANLLRSAKVETSASLAPTTVQLSTATVTFQQVTTPGVTTESGLDMGTLPKFPAGVTFTGLAYDISTTAVYQNASPNDVQVCFNVPALAPLNPASLRIYHLESGVWVNRTATGNTLAAACTTGLTSLSPFALGSLAPSAAEASVAGRITTANGNGIRGAVIRLTEANGTTRTARTGSFGYYSFEDVTAGQNVVIQVTSKRYSFANPSQIVTVSSDLSEVSFTAQE